MAATTKKPDIMKGLTKQFKEQYRQYIVHPKDAILPDYHTVCGKEDKYESPLTTNLLTQFTKQIGCPATNHETWLTQQNHYRDQFTKARTCFHGRVKEMGRHKAATPEEIASRQRHAYAAQAAYVLGRNCIRKFANLPTAKGLFEESAQNLIRNVDSAQSGVKVALNTELETPGSLQEIYEDEYGLSPIQWELYRKFLQYSAIKAENYNRGATEVKAARNAFYGTFVDPVTTDSIENDSVTAVGGAGYVSSSAASPNNVMLATKLAQIKLTNENRLLNKDSHIIDLPQLSLLSDEELRTSIISFNGIEKFVTSATSIITNFKNAKLIELFLSNPKKTLKIVLLPLIYYTTLLNIAIAKINAIDVGIEKIESRISSVQKTHRYEDSPFYKDVLVPVRDRIDAYRKLRQIISDLFVFFEENKTVVVSAISKDNILLSDFHILTKYNSDKTDYPVGYPISTLLRLSWQDTWPYLNKDDKMTLFDEMLTILQKGKVLV